MAVDTEKNIIRIMIEGKEVGRFDKSGLHVNGDIAYSGMISDVPFAPAAAPSPEGGAE